MAKHGKAVMPWGKWKGIPVCRLPDEYLCWLSTADVLELEPWGWLKASIEAELKFRGFSVRVIDEPMMKKQIEVTVVKKARKVPDEEPSRVRRKFRFD